MTPGPRLLALDTATPRAALVVLGPGGLRVSARPDPQARHGRVLVPAIRQLLADAGLRLADLDGLLVGLGPGSYTGLRIGLTAAKTLAYAVGRPLAGFDSLELVARGAPPGVLEVSAIADAQRGDLYVADFRRLAPGGPLIRRAPTRVATLDEWASAVSAETFVVGPAVSLDRIRTRIPGHVRLPDDPEAHWPDPDRLAELAGEVWRCGRRDDPWFLEPVYLRRSAAEEQWERKDGAA